MTKFHFELEIFDFLFFTRRSVFFPSLSLFYIIWHHYKISLPTRFGFMQCIFFFYLLFYYYYFSESTKWKKNWVFYLLRMKKLNNWKAGTVFFFSRDLYRELLEKRLGSSRRARYRRPGSILEPDTYSFQVIFATFVAMDDSGSRGCWAGRKEEDSPSHAFVLNHLPLCATNSRSPNLLQNFLNVARSYCSEKLILKLNQNDGIFPFFTRQMSLVKYYVMQFKTTVFLPKCCRATCGS